MLLLRRELENALDAADIEAALSTDAVISVRGGHEAGSGTKKSERDNACEQLYSHRLEFPEVVVCD